MTERERIAKLAFDTFTAHNWPGKHASGWPNLLPLLQEGWLVVADAIIADRREQNVFAIEHMEGRIEAAEARANITPAREESTRG